VDSEPVANRMTSGSPLTPSTTPALTGTGRGPSAQRGQDSVVVQMPASSVPRAPMLTSALR
jgi:hypothetical protein